MGKKHAKVKNKKEEELSYSVMDSLNEEQKKKLNEVIKNNTTTESANNINITITECINKVNKMNLFKPAKNEFDIDEDPEIQDKAITKLIDKLNEIPKNKQFLETLEKMNKDFKIRRNQLIENQKKVELALNDISHVIEGTRASASEGYVYYKAEHLLRVKRRELKYESMEIKIMILILVVIMEVLRNSKVEYIRTGGYDRYKDRIISKNKDILVQVNDLIDSFDR